MDYCKRIHARTDKGTRHTYTHYAQFTTADKKRGLDAEDDSSEWNRSTTGTVATAAIATVAAASAVLLLLLILLILLLLLRLLLYCCYCYCCCC